VYIVKFNARGTAGGPLPGTFIASGDWEWNPGVFAAFAESFSIKTESSDSHTLSGAIAINTKDTKGFDCNRFDRSVPYRMHRGGKWHGTVSVGITAKPSSFRNYFRS
jgi:hypothetical protein